MKASIQISTEPLIRQWKWSQRFSGNSIRLEREKCRSSIEKSCSLGMEPAQAKSCMGCNQQSHRSETTQDTYKLTSHQHMPKARQKATFWNENFYLVPWAYATYLFNFQMFTVKGSSLISEETWTFEKLLEPLNLWERITAFLIVHGIAVLC